VSLKTKNHAPAEPVLVPGSVANLGGGFDTLGVAVGLFLRARIVEVREDGGSCLKVVRSTPPVTGENALERAFSMMAARWGRPTPTVLVEVDSDIPMAAGLGSSAAATVAGLRVFESVVGPLSNEGLLAVAAEAEGHADNAAPALLGGLTSVVEAPGGPVALEWTWPEGLRLVVATPSVGLATAHARAALPEMLARKDAIFNLQRVLSLVHALQAGDDGRLREAVRDRWHQPARASLVPLLREALSIDDPDVLGTFLSGAGPSIAMLARNTARVEQILAALYQRAEVPVAIRTLGVHRETRSLAGAGASAAAHGRIA
jgi:homoserine kinase